MIIYPINRKIRAKDFKMARHLFFGPLELTPMSPGRRRRQYRGLIRGLMHGTITPCVVMDEQYENALAVMTMEKIGNRLNFRTISGCFKDHSDWAMHLVRYAEWAAKLNKCNEVSLAGRPAWKRILRPFGFFQYGEYMVKKMELET